MRVCLCIGVYRCVCYVRSLVAHCCMCRSGVGLPSTYIWIPAVQIIVAK